MDYTNTLKDTKPIGSPAPVPPHPDSKPKRKNKNKLWAVIAAAVAIVIGGILWWNNNSDNTESDWGELIAAGVSEPDGYINGYGYVDMGGNMGRWACQNVGALSPTGYGNYYQWGETRPAPNNNYTESNCRLYGKNVSDIGGDSRYDAATANWESGWRLPTQQQYNNLIAGCNTEVRTINGVEGMLFTSKANGNTLFFPFAGDRIGTSSYGVGSYGVFWSSTPYSFTDYAYYSFTDYAYFLCVESDGTRDTIWFYRDRGYSVRAVPE